MGKSIKRVTKRDLIKVVAGLGYNQRQSLRVVTHLFHVIESELQSHDSVELPGLGTLMVVRSPGPERSWKLNRIVTRYRQKYTIKLR